MYVETRSALQHAIAAAIRGFCDWPLMPRRNTPAKPNGAGGGRHRPTPELDRYLQPQPGAETVRQRSSAMLPRAPLLCPAAAGCMAMLLRPPWSLDWLARLHAASRFARF
jgi:hypothetical protein